MAADATRTPSTWCSWAAAPGPHGGRLGAAAGGAWSWRASDRRRRRAPARRRGRRARHGRSAPLDISQAAHRRRDPRRHRLRRQVRGRQADRPADDRVLRQPALQGAWASPRASTSACACGAWAARPPRSSTASCWPSCRARTPPTRWATRRCARSSGEISGLAFLVRERGVVVSLTCGTGQCTEPGSCCKLAKLVESRLPDLPSRRPRRRPGRTGAAASRTIAQPGRRTNERAPRGCLPPAVAAAGRGGAAGARGLRPGDHARGPHRSGRRWPRRCTRCWRSGLARPLGLFEPVACSRRRRCPTTAALAEGAARRAGSRGRLPPGRRRRRHVDGLGGRRQRHRQDAGRARTEHASTTPAAARVCARAAASRELGQSLRLLFDGGRLARRRRPGTDFNLDGPPSTEWLQSAPRTTSG